MLDALYHDRLKSGALRPDPVQKQALGVLGRLASDLTAKPPTRAGWLARFGGRDKTPHFKGVYLWGGVGAGKTMMMDLFFEAAAEPRKRRVHFHAFMLEVHDFLHKRRVEKRGAVDDGLIAFAHDFSRDVRLLCFDELYVTDVADAMILSRLFTALMDAGVTVVATSNFAPDDLYKDGLQRERFLPFIALIKARMDVVNVIALADYRMNRAREMGSYFWPDDKDARRAVDGIFGVMTDGAAGMTEAVIVKGHTVHVPRAARGVAVFGFADLCAHDYGVVDYLALAGRYHSFIITDVPIMDDEVRDKLRRFITLIDTLYERRRRLVMTAAAAPERLYAGDKDEALFVRTVSRMMEMQSADYAADAALAAAPAADAKAG